nr:LrgB family protein [Spirochaetota bacterium]
MNQIVNSQLFWVTLTIGLFLLGKYLSTKTKFIIFNPVLFSVTILIILLKLTGIEYSSYKSNTDIISFFLAPSVIALALPLYKELEEIKKNHLAIFISLTAGSLAGLLSVSGISLLLGADTPTVISLLPKSVTSAIAIE